MGQVKLPKTAKFSAVIVVLALCGGSAFAQRKPTVTFSVLGSAGAWDLDFRVTNNLILGEGHIYFFGVLLDTGRNIRNTPVNWDSELWTVWNNKNLGGSNTDYNNNWINLKQNATAITEGQSQSGFIARYTGAVAPTTVPFFAFAEAGFYSGDDYFNKPRNPGWEGTAVVPEPVTVLSLMAGLAAMAFRKRNR
jgi:hypothetical protein